MGGASGAVFKFVSEKCPPPHEGAQKCISEPEFLCAFPSWPFGYKFPSVVLNAVLSG